MTTFEIITKNNKPFLKMTIEDFTREYKIYKAGTNEAYIKAFGTKFYLTDENINNL